MRKLLVLGIALAAIAVLAPAAAMAQEEANAYPFEASVLQAPSGLAVFQRYYTEGKTTVNPACEGACPTKPCDNTGGMLSCQLIHGTKGLTGYRGYSEDVFNFGVTTGTVFNAVFDYEANSGAGNHQGFYAWVRGAVANNSTSLWNEATCTGASGTACLGVATSANARSETVGVPTSSGGPALPNIGGLSPIPVPKAAPGSSQTSFNLSWAAISSVGEAAGVAPAGYEVWGARTANCAVPATAEQFAFVRLVNGTSATIDAGEVPGSGAGFTFALKIRFPAAGGNTVATRFLSANGQCFLGGGLSANVYELAAKYARKTNVEVTWKTSLEDGVRGFYVSRATTQSGPFTRVSELIAAKGEASAYSFIDTVQAPSGTVKATGLWYKVETIDIDDNAVEYGPTKAQLPGPNRDAIIKQRTVKPQR